MSPYHSISPCVIFFRLHGKWSSQEVVASGPIRGLIDRRITARRRARGPASTSITPVERT